MPTKSTAVYSPPPCTRTETTAGLRRSLHPASPVAEAVGGSRGGWGGGGGLDGGTPSHSSDSTSSSSRGRRKSSRRGGGSLGGRPSAVTMDSGGGHRIEKSEDGVSVLTVPVGGREVRWPQQRVHARREGGGATCTRARFGARAAGSHPSLATHTRTVLPVFLSSPSSSVKRRSVLSWTAVGLG